jgi:lysozyme family protein
VNTQTPQIVSRPQGWTAAHESRWQALQRRILVVEGGFVDDPVDRGGTTKYGVSLRFLQAVGKIDANRDGFADLDLNFDRVLDGHDIRALTPRIAGDLFLKHFYLQPGFWVLPRPFDAALFDQAVNGGTTAAIKILQRALNRFGPPRLSVDGALGNITQAKLLEQMRAGAPVIQAIREEAAARYRAIVAADPDQRKYLKGWLRRAEELGRE